MKNVLIICLTLWLKSTFGQNPPSLLKYTNKDFTLGYPANWDTVRKDIRMTFMAVEKKKNDKDSFRENFCIYSIGINEHVYLQTLIEKASAEFIKQGNPEANILKQTVKRNKQEISYGIFKTKTQTKGKTIISTCIYFLDEKKNKVFVLTFSNDNLENAVYENLFQLIIDSFVFR